MNTVLDQLALRATLQGDEVFLGECGRQLTFSEFSVQVRRCAAYFQTNGVGYGDRIILHISGRTHHLTAYMAAMTIGAIPVHLYAERSVAEVACAVEQTTAVLVVTDQQRDAWAASSLPLITVPDLNDSDLPQVQQCQPHEIAYMMLTSGTTGTPKAVMTTHANIGCVTRNLIQIAGMTDAERELIVMPLGSTGGLGHFHAHLWLGNYIQFMPCFFGTMTDADRLQMLNIIESERMTGLLSTPGMLSQLATQHREMFRGKAHRLRYILANVCPIRPELVIDLMGLLPSTRFCTYYGLTEASRSAAHCYNDNPEKLSAAGKAMSEVEIKIKDPDSQGIGEVMIRGQNVTAGYWGRDDALDAAGWLPTGDSGVIDSDGFLTIKGRVRDNINVDGLKFLPGDVEDVLKEHPAVAECAVVGLPHPVKFQQPVAAVVTESAADRITLQDQLDDHCSERLAFYKRPTKYVFIDELPLTDLGKVRRDALTEVILIQSEAALVTQ
ncbi:MAG: long-chain-fatty-acid--CoA ligase [Lysobacteraceae bacterium]|nr:MAG: long-chain-fatty-acid--CoA ligase [Xanthomonadaceae bacterium]